MVATPTPKVPAWPPRSAPRLFVSDRLGEGQILTLEGQQAHYLARVMRVSSGDAVILCDNISGEWAAKVTEADKRRVTVELIEKLRERDEVPDFWLCPALLKKDRFDMVLEKASELGVRALHPVIMRRCVADKLNMERARTVTIEAAEQCARTALPALEEPRKLAAMLRDWPAERALFFADEAQDSLPANRSAAHAFAAHNGPAALLIGPEGGFDDEERAMLHAHPQVQAISLGPRILRGETAAIAATALWMGVRGDWADD